MVAQERMKAAHLEAELREFASEREALKLAMWVLEEENQQFRNILGSASQAVPQVKPTTSTQRLTPSPSRSHSRHSSRSSLPVSDAAGSVPGSPYANLQQPTPVEHLPSVGNETCPEHTSITVDSTKHRETVQPQPRTWSPLHSLEVECWPRSPDTS